MRASANVVHFLLRDGATLLAVLKFLVTGRELCLVYM